MSPDFNSLINFMDEKLEIIKSRARHGPSLIYAEETVDGLIASAISFDLLRRLGTKPTVRFISPWAPSADLSSFSADIRLGIGLSAGSEENAINLGVDGGISAERFGFTINEASLSTLAHLFRNREFRSPSTNYLAIAGSLSSLMDYGEFRELNGLNKAVLDEGIAVGALGSERRIDLGFGYILPLHSSISASVDPYFKNITGNSSASASILSENGLPLKAEDRYLTLKDMNDDQLELLARVLDKHSKSGPVKRNTYYQNTVDESFFEWNIRDFALILDLLIASGSTALAFRLASGLAAFNDYDDAWRTSMTQLGSDIDKVNRILTNRQRVIDEEKSRRIIATDILNFRESLMVMKWISRWDEMQGHTVTLETVQGTDKAFIIFPSNEELVNTAQEIGEFYGARVRKMHPFILISANVIKADQFYDSLRSRAGVP